MNKLELIKTLRNECQISKNEAETIVDLYINEMANALAGEDPGIEENPNVTE